MLKVVLQEPHLIRNTSMTTTEMTDSEDAFLETSLRTFKVMLPGGGASTPLTDRSSSMIDMELSQAELDLLATTFQKGLPRSILKVVTQEESLKQSLDVRLAQGPAIERQSSVSFGQLHIREFALRPGDNPGCRIGVSLTIDWDVQQEHSVDVEAYEETRPARRDRGELNIPSETRMRMLRDSGYTRAEILQYVKMANIARGQRSRTNETQQLAGAQELAQRFCRGILNKTTRRSSKKKEKKLLQASRVKDQQLSVLRRQSMVKNPPPREELISSEPDVTGRWDEDETSEQAPVIPTRRPKRDSLAIIAPVAPAAEDASVSSEISSSSSTSAPEDAPLEDKPEAPEVDC